LSETDTVVFHIDDTYHFVTVVQKDYFQRRDAEADRQT